MDLKHIHPILDLCFGRHQLRFIDNHREMIVHQPNLPTEIMELRRIFSYHRSQFTIQELGVVIDNANDLTIAWLHRRLQNTSRSEILRICQLVAEPNTTANTTIIPDAKSASIIDSSLLAAIGNFS
jgi:hypothetical protein